MEVVDDKLIGQLIDKTKKNSRGVPTMVFIDNVDAWIDKCTAEKLVEDQSTTWRRRKRQSL